MVFFLVSRALASLPYAHRATSSPRHPWLLILFCPPTHSFFQKVEKIFKPKPCVPLASLSAALLSKKHCRELPYLALTGPLVSLVRLFRLGAIGTVLLWPAASPIPRDWEALFRLYSTSPSPLLTVSCDRCCPHSTGAPSPCSMAEL